MMVPMVMLAGLWFLQEDCPDKKAAKAIAPLPAARIEALSAFASTYPEAIELQIEQTLKAQAESNKDARQRGRAARDYQIEIREAMGQAHKELQKLGVTRQWIAHPTFAQGFSKAFFDFGGPEPRLSLSIEDMSIRDAIKKVFKATKFEFSFDDDVCKDIRITLKAPNVRLSTALDMITDAGDVNWTREMRINSDEPTPTIHYRIRKSMPRDHIAIVQPSVAGPSKIIEIGGPGRKLLSSGTSEKFSFGVLMPEVRSKIECPHCHGKVVAYRPKKVDRCEKCGTQYAEGKNICAKDGTRRPTPPKPWKFCPLCGKPVDYRD